MATDIELLGNVDWVMLQSCFDVHFLLVLEKQESAVDGVQTFFAVVQLIGTSKQADNFIYRCLPLSLLLKQLVSSPQLVAVTFCRFQLMEKMSAHFQVDHSPGKPAKVREFRNGQGKVRENGKSQGK